MTQPKQARQRSGGRREYTWPPTGDPELVVPSVTTILSEGLPKPALVGWATKVTAEAAIDMADILATMVKRGRKEEALRMLKSAANASRDAAAARGTAVHAAIEAYSKGWLEYELTDDRQGYYQAALRFFADYKPETIANEVTVYSRTYGYGGTLDYLAALKSVPTIIDFKTSKSIYGDNALQLTAYARADFIGRDDGVEDPLPEVGHGMIVRLGADGSYEIGEAELTDEDFVAFLAVKAVGEWRDGRAKSVFRKHTSRPAA